MFGKKMKPRIVYIHGDGVLHWSWGWVPRLRDDLQRAGFSTFFETFPDSIDARAKYWLPFLREHIHAGQSDVLVGWSCGAAAAMRFVQEQQVRGLVLIAPYYTDLGLESVRQSGFVTQAWDWKRIKEMSGPIAIFHSDNDPYISQAEFASLTERLGGRRYEIRGAGHFGEQQTFPQLTDYLLETYG